MNNVIDLLDHIDAAIFSGDALYDGDTRAMLEIHSRRWLRAVEEWEANEAKWAEEGGVDE